VGPGYPILCLMGVVGCLLCGGVLGGCKYSRGGRWCVINIDDLIVEIGIWMKVTLWSARWMTEARAG